MDFYQNMYRKGGLNTAFLMVRTGALVSISSKVRLTSIRFLGSYNSYHKMQRHQVGFPAPDPSLHHLGFRVASQNPRYLDELNGADGLVVQSIGVIQSLGGPCIVLCAQLSPGANHCIIPPLDLTSLL
jgi:hypothetical protein